MMHPTVHLNGTPRERLLEGYCEAATAVRKAIEKLCTAAPHGRDYYPQGDQAIKTAVAEHEARVQRLRDTLAEIETLGETLAFGG